MITNTIQKELHQLNEKQSIDIEIIKIVDGFLIKFENGRSKDETFSISLTNELMITLFKEYDKKSNEFIVKEELLINSVNFDFYRGNSLYFDIYFTNKLNKLTYQARMYVFYKTNNHGSLGDIYAFHLINNAIQ
ncbi:MAG: hypothetical protein ACPGVH_06195 [Chitinophagales bacterium]